MFSTQSGNCIPFVHIFDISLFTAEMEKPKTGISGGKGRQFLIQDPVSS